MASHVGNINNYYSYGSTQAPINFYSEDFIAGFTGGGSNRMSVVRRFFCLFVTFDLVFVGLLWVICVVINGENIYKALDEQVLNYNIETSLFDVVGAAGIRFIMLIFFYGMVQINHWIIIALTTTLSCGFLIVKVFYFIWPSNQPVFQVLLIICSFVISWFECWFLDSRVIPQEDYSRTLSTMLQSSTPDSRTPLLPHFLNSLRVGSIIQGPESSRNFYSPAESDDEDEEFKHLGLETVQKAYELLESSNWKIEKVTGSNDSISTCSRSVGRVYKLSGKVNYPPKKLLQELFYNIENFPSWNPTLLESKIIRKIDSNTDIAYSVSASGGGGIVKSRDFVNLRCWKLIRNSKVVENYNINSSISKFSFKSHSSDGDNENSSDDEDNDNHNKSNNENRKKSFNVVNEKSLKKSASVDNVINGVNNEESNEPFHLSKSLGAKEIITSEDDEPYSDAQTDIQNDSSDAVDNLENCIFVSAAMSIDYALYPATNKYVRGDNLISCWAMRHVPNEPENCIFEWLMCIDLKGSLPKYVLNAAFTSLMTDYMIHLRSRIQQLNDENSNNQCA
jgi:hypothetical protein